MGFPDGLAGKESICNAGDMDSVSGSENLELGMTTHSNILAWRVPWTEDVAGHSPKCCKELGTTEQACNATSYIKSVKSKSYVSSHHKENVFSFLKILHLYEMMDVH